MKDHLIPNFTSQRDAWRDHSIWYKHEYDQKFITLEDTRKIVFYNNTNEKRRSAVIDFSGDVVTYSGDLDVDESAKMFFDVLGNLLKS